MHHGKDANLAQHLNNEFCKSFLNSSEKLGATGNFPEGKLIDTDEGEIKMAIGTKDNKVIIDFGTQVVWIGFSKNQAIDLAKSIIEKANNIKSN